MNGFDKVNVVQPYRVSAVSFFNTAPLVYGLKDDPRIRLRFGVPSSLIDDLINDAADVALLPVIDYQQTPGLRVIPSAGIGCDGPTLTVRLFARTPLEHTRRLAADTDSHTSVALARVIFDKLFNLRPTIVPLSQATDEPGETRLLIGDKVITHAPAGFDHQLDLGEAWKKLTGLPFVFAIWTARPDVALGDLPQRLAIARERGLMRVDELVANDAVARGWPPDTARRYLTDYLKFSIGPRQLDAIHRFHALAADVGAIDHAPDPLRIAD
ncbi:MAG: menaquinone biosynthetic enzyme MqnA/MqnD family protein [Tepidisphaeraceae bacterium]